MEKFTAPEYKRFINSSYDLYCPSVQPLLSSRMCSECDLYFATKFKLYYSQKNCIQGSFTTRETNSNCNVNCLLLSLQMTINPEWIDENEVNIQDLRIPNMAHSSKNPIPTTSLDEHLSINGITYKRCHT